MEKREGKRFAVKGIVTKPFNGFVNGQVLWLSGTPESSMDHRDFIADVETKQRKNLFLYSSRGHAERCAEYFRKDPAYKRTLDIKVAEVKLIF
jgi:hypothetical protein